MASVKFYKQTHTHRQTDKQGKTICPDLSMLGHTDAGERARTVHPDLC